MHRAEMPYQLYFIKGGTAVFVFNKIFFPLRFSPTSLKLPRRCVCDGFVCRLAALAAIQLGIFGLISINPVVAKVYVITFS